MTNLSGSVGGKYGANTHLSVHRRRRILQAAQGPWTVVGREEGEGEGEELDEEADKIVVETPSVAVVLCVYSILREGKRQVSCF